MKYINQYGVILFSCLTLISCAGMKEAHLGNQLAEEKNWEGAVLAYQAALKKDPMDKGLRQKLDQAKSHVAESHFLKGKDYLAANQTPLALEEFRQALVMNPTQQEYQSALNEALKIREAGDHYNVGMKLMRASKFQEAREELEKAIALIPSYTPPQKALSELSEREATAAHAQDEPALKSAEPITLRFQNARLNEVFEFLSKASGITFLLDQDLRPETITVSISLKQVPLQEALNLILTTHNLFMKSISKDAILIIPKTPQKISQYEDLLIRTFYIANAKAKDIVNLLRTMLDTQRFYVNEELNAIVMQDTPEKIKLAEKLIEAHDRKQAEVLFDVEVLEVDRDKSLKLGWNLNPSQVVAGIAGAGAISLEKLKNLSDAAYIFTLPSVIVDFLKTESDAQTLANPRIRVLDNKSAKVNIGDRVPVLLSSSTFAAGSATSAAGTTVTTNVEFKDTGVKLEVKPDIQLNNDVTLEMKLEVTSLGQLVDLGNNQKQFKFGNRSVETVLNMRDGETVIIGGLISDEERKVVNKLPVLGDLPILGYLFSNLEKRNVKTDILLGCETNLLVIFYAAARFSQNSSHRPLI